MKAFALLLLSLPLFSGCAGETFAPPPIISIAPTSKTSANATQLADGRRLFTTRCLECHTLPPVKKYSPAEWPNLVAEMAPRAELTRSEETAVAAYLCAASKH